MIDIKTLKTMKNTSQNVSCGLVTWQGLRFFGCGERVKTHGFYYNAGHGCFSSVFLCSKCVQRFNLEV